MKEKDKERKIIFLTNGETLNFLEDKQEDIFFSYGGTKEAIRSGKKAIYTFSLANMSFSLLDKGYRIYLMKNNLILELKPGMPELEKELRKEHNILKIFLSTGFESAFKNLQKGITFKH